MSITLGPESCGIRMTPDEFDNADYDECYRYELVDGLVMVSELSDYPEADINEELGCWLRNFGANRVEGLALDCTLPNHLVNCGANRRFAHRVIWAELGRHPRKNETPTVIVEFVSSQNRDRQPDYEAKLGEYQKLKVQEYWIIDRFEKIMTAHILDNGYRKKVVTAKQTYRTKLLPGFELPVARLFALADEWEEEGDNMPENHR